MLDAQAAFAALLLSLAAVLIGLLTASSPYLSGKDPDRPRPQWVVSVLLFAQGLLIFSWLTVRIEDFSKPSFAISTLANLSFFIASFLLADFFRRLNPDRNQINLWYWMPVTSIFYIGVFEWARSGTVDDRIIVSASMWEVVIAWQFIELKALRKKVEASNLGFLLVVISFEFLCGLCRILISLINQNNITTFESFSKFHIVFATLQIFLAVVTFIGVSKFWTERVSRKRESERVESERIKHLISEKDKLVLKLLASNKTAASGALSASIVHEITQPVTAVSLRLASLIRKVEESDAYAHLQNDLMQCKAGADKIKETVKTIRLIFSRDDAQVEHIDLVAMASEVVRIATAACKDFEISITYRADKPVIALASYKEIQHIIFNLVLNSIDSLKKSSSSKKEICLFVRDFEDTAMLSVIDTGDGLSEEMEGKIFSLFESEKSDGMGIGLWLCRQIAERNRCEISYRPNAPTGAVFDVRMPKSTELQ